MIPTHALRLVASLVAALAVGNAPVCAQTYPERAVRLIVPFSPGGTGDVLARLVSEELFKAWNKPAVVINRDGADTILGVDMAAKSSPDGHTLLIGPTAMAINAGLGRQVPYDIRKDLEPVTLALMQPLALVASPVGPITSLADLIRTAKADPNKLRYGSLGMGGIPNMSMELLKVSAGVNLIQVPYKGSPAAIIDLMSGQIDLLFSGVTSVAQHIKTGRLRGIAITSKSRTPLLPDLPTIAESGFPNYQTTSWYGVLVKSGTPPVVVNRLGSELRRILALPPLRQKMADQGGEVASSTPEQFGAFLNEEIRKWAAVTKAQRISVQ